MLCRAACVGLLVSLAGCRTDTISVNDLWDAALQTPDAAPPATPDAGFSRDEHGPHGDGCLPESKIATFRPPSRQIMILLDRSSAMQATFSGGGNTKQNAVQNLLINDLIPAYQGLVEFGLELFPGEAATCPHGSCCADNPVTVKPGANALALIANGLQCSSAQPCQATADSPSYQALSVVRDYYLSLKLYMNWVSQPAYVLLLTASDPVCSAEAVPNILCSNAVNAAVDLGQADVPVVIFSLGNSPDSHSCLSRLSSVGSRTPQLPGGAPRLNTVTSASGLKDALSGLLAAIARQRCTVATTDYVPEGAALEVTVGTTSVKQGGADGWSFDAGNRFAIKLSGSACERYLDKPDAAITAAFTCSNCGGPNSCNPPPLPGGP